MMYMETGCAYVFVYLLSQHVDMSMLSIPAMHVCLLQGVREGNRTGKYT